MKFKNPSPRILVVGDLMLDHYLWGKCDRISPEAPVQIVDIAKETVQLGGAGNVLNNLVTFGAVVDIASVIGRDRHGEQLVELLNSLKINTELLIVEEDRKTTKKSRILANHQHMLRIDYESRNDITQKTEDILINKITGKLNQYDIILLSDYNKGLLTERLCQQVIGSAKKVGKKVIIDPKGLDYTKYRGAHLVKPNKKETQLATNIDIHDDESLIKAGKRLQEKFNLEKVVITLSEEGIVIFDADKIERIPTKARDVYDVTGAGDTVLSSVGYCLANEINIYDACEYANYAAAVVIGKVGAATATKEEIEHYRLHAQNIHLRVIENIDHLKQLSLRINPDQEKIIYIEGRFDKITPDTLKFLEDSKNNGDLLIVGIGSAHSDGYPLYERAKLLSCLNVIDYVVIQSELKEDDILQRIRPHSVFKH